MGFGNKTMKKLTDEQYEDLFIERLARILLIQAGLLEMPENEDWIEKGDENEEI